MSQGDFGFFNHLCDAPLYIRDNLYKGDHMIYTVRIATAQGYVYYIGSTTKGVERLKQHKCLGSMCAEFIRRHCGGDNSKLSFSTCCFSCKGDCDIEVSETREAQIRAMLHGVSNVSGGEVTSRQAPIDTLRSICHQANLCQQCGLPGHFARQ